MKPSTPLRVAAVTTYEYPARDRVRARGTEQTVRIMAWRARPLD